MTIIKCIACILSLAIVQLHAETMTYLIYRHQCFPDDKYVREISPKERKLFSDAGKKTIEEAGGQPSRMTRYSLNFDGKYAIFNVDAEFDPDKNQFKKMVSDGCAIMLSSETIKSAYYRDAPIVVSIVETLGTVPTDFFKVEVSTK